MYMNKKRKSSFIIKKKEKVNQGAKLSYYMQNKFVSYFIGHMLQCFQNLNSDK